MAAPLTATPPTARATRSQLVRPVDATAPPAAIRSRMEPQINVSASTMSEVFQLARRAANAVSELADTELQLQQLGLLHAKKAIPRTQVRVAELKHAKLKREVELNQLQIDALTTSLEGQLKLAEKTLAHAKSKLQLVDSAFLQGMESNQNMLQARFDVEKAEAAQAVAAANIQQLKTAMKLIQRLDDVRDADEESGKPSADDDAADRRESRRDETTDDRADDLRADEDARADRDSRPQLDDDSVSDAAPDPTAFDNPFAL